MEELQRLESNGRFEGARAIAGTIGASLGALVLGLDAAVWLLLGSQVADFVSGIIAASIRREVDSRVGWAGIGRKVLVWCAVGLAAGVQRYFAALGVHVAIPLPAVGELQLPHVGLSAAVCVG